MMKFAERLVNEDIEDMNGMLELDTRVLFEYPPPVSPVQREFLLTTRVHETVCA